MGFLKRIFKGADHGGEVLFSGSVCGLDDEHYHIILVAANYQLARMQLRKKFQDHYGETTPIKSMSIVRINLYKFEENFIIERGYIRTLNK